MTGINTQILETWGIHNRILLLVLQNIPEEAMDASMSARGGRDISRQFAHLFNVRMSRLSSFSNKLGIDLVPFEKGESPDKDRLLEVFKLSGEVMEKYIRTCIEKNGEVSNFKRGIVPMLGYYISHEAHHRGSILLTMKLSGYKLPDVLKWGIWEWNKI